MRTNTTKARILQLLEAAHLLRLEDIQARLADDVDFSTVYRNVQQLVADGVLKKVVLDSKVTVYELASHDHNHFVCDSCQQVEVIDVSIAAKGARSVRDVVVRGSCEKCAH